MSLVVDTSIIIAVLTNEKNKSKLLKLTKSEELIAPALGNRECFIRNDEKKKNQL